MSIKRITLVALMLSVNVLLGCTGQETFSNAVRAGDTVTLMIGYNRQASRQNTSFTVTDSAGAVTQYDIGDPNIRAVLNLYPDPASNLRVALGIGKNVSANEMSILTGVNSKVGGEREWAVTVAMIDLPDDMALGSAAVAVDISGGQWAPGIAVEIIGTGGSPHSLGVIDDPDNLTGSGNERIQSLERAPHKTILFDAATIPHSIQVDVTHDDLSAAGGVGDVYAINPTSDAINLSWSDDGTIMRGLLTPVEGQPTATQAKKYYKFYVAGGAQNLQIDSVQGFDENGIEIAGVLAGIGPPEVTSTLPSGNNLLIYGDYLCAFCAGASKDPWVWIKKDTGWLAGTVTHTTSDTYMIVQFPENVGTGQLWISTPGGELYQPYP